MLGACKNNVLCVTCRDQGVATYFVLAVKEFIREKGQKQVGLRACLIRRLGTLSAPDGPAWFTNLNTLNIHEFEYMADIWQHWEKYVARISNL